MAPHSSFALLSSSSSNIWWDNNNILSSNEWDSSVSFSYLVLNSVVSFSLYYRVEGGVGKAEMNNNVMNKEAVQLLNAVSSDSDSASDLQFTLAPPPAVQIRKKIRTKRYTRTVLQILWLGVCFDSFRTLAGNSRNGTDQLPLQPPLAALWVFWRLQAFLLPSGGP